MLTPSPHRIDPKCPLFGRCGGCQYQHLTYAEQLKWKRQQVEELLKFMAGVEFAVNPVIGSPREFGYRSKITPHFHCGLPIADRGLGKPIPIGFLKQGTRFGIIDVPQCPIATPEINEKLPEVRARTRARLAAGEYKRDATLLLRHAQEGVITDYDAVIHEVIAQPANPQSAIPNPQSLRLHFLARDFFQNNPFILPAFTGYVREQATALESAMRQYGIDGSVVGIESGPVITMYDLKLSPGTKVAAISAVSSDISAESAHERRSDTKPTRSDPRSMAMGIAGGVPRRAIVEAHVPLRAHSLQAALRVLRLPQAIQATPLG